VINEESGERDVRTEEQSKLLHLDSLFISSWFLPCESGDLLGR
jgi:hypothetical protein